MEINPDYGLPVQRRSYKVTVRSTITHSETSILVRAVDETAAERFALLRLNVTPEAVRGGDYTVFVQDAGGWFG